MTPRPFSPAATRNAISSSIPRQTAGFGTLPEQQFLYVPRAHVRALDPDSMLVEGMRGAGKSLWWSALQSEPHRKIVAAVLGRSELGEGVRVTPGFGENPKPDYPDMDTLKRLLTFFDARMIWRGVVASHFLKDRFTSGQTWQDRIGWVNAHPEEVASVFYEADARLSSSREKHIFLFDALDRAAGNWADLRQLLRGLLQNLLDFRAYRAIRAKAFVRPDMLDDPEVRSFPDASKVISNKVDLNWPRNELFSLLWQYIGNAAEGGDVFREECETLFHQVWRRADHVWIIPEAMRTNEALQREIFHAISGPWMGRNPKRGFPYTWLPNHLGDAYGRTSPRSFLAAIREAGEETGHPDHPYALHFEAIQKGVQKASSIRVLEVEEDSAWIGLVMKPLHRLVIPCAFEEIEQRWENANVLPVLTNLAQGVPPRRLEEGHRGIVEDLIEIGVFQRMSDGRINMPDVYRVGFGLGRKGGVKPVR